MAYPARPNAALFLGLTLVCAACGGDKDDTGPLPEGDTDTDTDTDSDSDADSDADTDTDTDADTDTDPQALACDPDLTETERYAAWSAEQISYEAYQYAVFEHPAWEMTAGDSTVAYDRYHLEVGATGETPLTTCDISSDGWQCTLDCEGGTELSWYAEVDDCYFTGVYLDQGMLAVSVSWDWWLGGDLLVLDAEDGTLVWDDHLWASAAYLQITHDCLQLWHDDTNFVDQPAAAFSLWRASDGLPRLAEHEVGQAQFEQDLIAKIGE